MGVCCERRMTMPPPTGNREFRNEIVRIAELTVNTVVLKGLTFQNCRIIGPAVLVPLGEGSMNHCTFDVEQGGTDAIFWEITPDREYVVGAVALVDCHFSSCTFVSIGLAGPRDLREKLDDAISPSNGG